jgi:L-amino acid N-acyltransferase YncA
MIAVTGDGAILASIGLHRAMGFEPAGALPATGGSMGAGRTPC